MAYAVILHRAAEKELDHLPAKTRQRISSRLLELENDPRPHGVQKLQGHDGYRIRIGDYRVLYLINDKAKSVEVLAVGHRREVYR